MATPAEIDQFLASAERRAFKHAAYALQDPHQALDVVQNAMLKLVERYTDRPAEELPLLFQRILQNAIHDHFRRARVRNFWVRTAAPVQDADDDAPETLEKLAAHHGAPGPDSPEDLAMSGQHLALIEAALGELPARQREAFLLRYWEGFDIAETARVMGCGEGSVKTHCFRAVNALAQKLTAKGLTP